MNEIFIDCVKLDLTASAWLQLDTWRGSPNIMAADSENKCTAVRTRIVTNKRQKERLARNVKIRRIMVPVILISIFFIFFAFSLAFDLYEIRIFCRRKDGVRPDRLRLLE